MDIDNIKSQMRKGILEYCVLSLLSNRKAYPSDIIRYLSETNLIVVEGTIYTLLNRLRREGKLDYEWQESPKGPPRKYFFITESGREVLGVMDEAWQEISSTVDYVNALATQSPPDSSDSSLPDTLSSETNITLN